MSEKKQKRADESELAFYLFLLELHLNQVSALLKRIERLIENERERSAK